MAADGRAVDLEGYLERIGHQQPVDPTPETLASLHRAHLAAIPFENLDILLGRPIRLDLAALQEKLVSGLRGGYCFEQNTLFRAALEAVGFRVSSLAARVRMGSNVMRPRTHMLLRVDTKEGSFLADVGFGGDGPGWPLPLEEGAESISPIGAHRLSREGELFVLEGNLSGEWIELYAFTLEPHYAVDFEMASYFTSTHPRSPFVQGLTAQRSWPQRRAILRNRELTILSRERRETEEIRDPAHLLEVLERTFGLCFPSGTRFAKPEF